MALPFVNVHNVPGVPAVNFNPVAIFPGSFLNPITLLTADLFTPAIFQSQQWGIFQNGFAVVTAESVSGFEFRKDYTVADYPIEGGSFETYDKVSIPYLAKIRFVSGFSPQTRQDLLQSVDLAATSFATYQAVTPEFIYTSCNVSHYDYRRESSRGVGLIVVEVWVTQIIVAGSTLMQFGTTANPASSATNNGGLVQGDDVTSPQQNTLGTFNSVA